MSSEEKVHNNQEYLLSLQERYYDLEFKYEKSLKRIRQLEQVIANNEINKYNIE